MPGRKNTHRREQHPAPTTTSSASHDRKEGFVLEGEQKLTVSVFWRAISGVGVEVSALVDVDGIAASLSCSSCRTRYLHGGMAGL